MLLDLDETDFTYKTIDKYTEKMTQEGISEEIYNKVAETANWLDEVFMQRNLNIKNLKHQKQKEGAENQVRQRLRKNRRKQKNITKS